MEWGPRTGKGTTVLRAITALDAAGGTRPAPPRHTDRGSRLTIPAASSKATDPRATGGSSSYSSAVAR